MVRTLTDGPRVSLRCLPWRRVQPHRARPRLLAPRAHPQDDREEEFVLRSDPALTPLAESSSKDGATVVFTKLVRRADRMSAHVRMPADPGHRGVSAHTSRTDTPELHHRPHGLGSSPPRRRTGAGTRPDMRRRPDRHANSAVWGRHLAIGAIST